MVDIDWGSCAEHIREIMDNRVPFKLFNDMNILCVLTNVLPGKNPKRVSTFTYPCVTPLLTQNFRATLTSTDRVRQHV